MKKAAAGSWTKSHKKAAKCELLEKLSKWQFDEAPAEDLQEEAVVHSDKRDKLKALAFARRLDSLPEWVRSAWNQPGNRQGKTQLVHAVVQRRPATGKVHFDLVSPTLEAATPHLNLGASLESNCKSLCSANTQCA